MRILRYMKKYWYIATLAPLMMLGEVSMDFFLTQYMQKMVDYGINTGSIENVTKYGLMMLGIVLLGVTFGILAGIFTNLACFKYSNDLRNALYEKIMQLSYNQADEFSTSTLITRVTNDVTQVQNMLSMSLRGLVRAASFFILGIVFTISISPRFGYLILIILPLELLIMIIFMKTMTPHFMAMRKKIDNLNTVVHENVSGARVIKAFGKEDYEYDRFVATNDDYTKTLLFVNKAMAFVMPLMMIIIYGASMFIYYYGGSSILEAFAAWGGIGTVDDSNMIMLGQITAAVTYISMICMSIMMLGMMFTMVINASASAKRINAVLDSKIEIEDGNLDINTLTEAGTIEFKNVGFKYEKASANVLSNMNFKINKGEMVAIVGSTGCGKTSLINLIPRFYDCTEGEVLVDGVNVKEFKLFELRDKIATCLQKAELFKGTIKENILWGKADASDEEIEEAIEISQAKEFIDTREKGLEEWVEEKGTSLSGGQKQRLSIARALIKKPEIIIFDDSTSALDLITEAKLHSAMRKFCPEMTKIVVAQRVATAKNADKIIVIDKGSIVGFDTHENLMKSCDIYQDIYNSQLKKEDVFDEFK